MIAVAVSLALHSQGQGTAADPYVLNPTASTVVWGYYWSEAKPALHIRSGDYVRVRTVLTSSPDKLEGAGVPASAVEHELRDVQAVKDRGPGGHVLTGPIYVEGAELRGCPRDPVRLDQPGNRVWIQWYWSGGFPVG